MTDMARKQFYNHKRQQILLKRLSQSRGVSESEIIHQAIERESIGVSSQASLPDRAAWEDILEFLVARRTLDQGDVLYQWNRRDAYAE